MNLLKWLFKITLIPLIERVIYYPSAKSLKDLETKIELHKQKMAILKARIERKNNPETPLLDTQLSGYRQTLDGLSKTELEYALRETDHHLTKLEGYHQTITGWRFSPLDEESPYYPYANTRAEMENEITAQAERIKIIESMLLGEQYSIDTLVLDKIDPDFKEIIDQYDQGALEEVLSILQHLFVDMEIKYLEATNQLPQKKVIPIGLSRH